MTTTKNINYTESNKSFCHNASHREASDLSAQMRSTQKAIANLRPDFMNSMKRLERFLRSNREDYKKY